MSHELIGVVTATPTGPVTIEIGQSVEVTASFTLDGPTDATASVYDIVWQNVTDSVGFASQFPALPNTPYTKNFIGLSLGTKVLRMTATFNSDATPPNNNQIVNSNDITVTVRPSHISIDGEFPSRSMEGGLESRAIDADLPSRSLDAGLESRSIEAELPSRSVEGGLG